MQDEDRRDLRLFVERGEREAFGGVLTRHADLLYTTALRVVGNRADAEEVVQEASLKAAGAAQAYRGDCSVKNWLFRIVFNTALDVRKKDRRRRRHQSQWAERKGRPKEDARLEEAIPFLEEAVGSLEPALQEVVLLHFYDRQSQTEIARDLGYSPKTIHVRIRKAVERLRAALLSQGYAALSPLVLPALAELKLVSAPSGLVAMMKASVLSSTALASGIGSASSGALVGGGVAMSVKTFIWSAAVIAAVGLGAGYFVGGGQSGKDGTHRRELARLEADLKSLVSERDSLTTEMAQVRVQKASMEKEVERLQVAAAGNGEAAQGTLADEEAGKPTDEMKATRPDRVDFRSLTPENIREALDLLRRKRELVDGQFGGLRGFLRGHPDIWLDLLREEKEWPIARILVAANNSGDLPTEWSSDGNIRGKSWSSGDKTEPAREYVEGSLALLADASVSEVAKLAVLKPYSRLPNNPWFFLLDAKSRGILLEFAYAHRQGSGRLEGVCAAILANDPGRRTEAVEAAEDALFQQVRPEEEGGQDPQVMEPALSVIYYYGDMASYRRVTGAIFPSVYGSTNWLFWMSQGGRTYQKQERDDLGIFMPPFLLDRKWGSNGLQYVRLSLVSLTYFLSPREMADQIHLYRSKIQEELPPSLVDKMTAYLESRETVDTREFQQLFGGP